jgi:signal transduction histidine kinase
MSSRWRDRLTRRFGFRLALWYFVLFAAGVAIILGLAYGLLAASLRARDREVVESTLVRYARAYDGGGLERLNVVIGADRSGGQYEPLFVRVFAGGQSAIYFSMPQDWNMFDLRQLSSPPLLGDRPWAEITATRSNERLEVASARLLDGTLFQVGKSTRSRDELLGRFRRIALLLLSAVVLAALAGGRLLTWSALGPLRDLSRTVESILRTGRTRARVPVKGTGDALDDLGALMNQMLDRIDALIGGMRGSLDNVAHDLRTPITRLRATAETALREPRSAEAYREALADCLEESDRVMTMLDALMDIAEAETGAMRLKIERFDLSAAIESAAELYRDLTEEKHMQFEIVRPDRIVVAADRARLTQAIANLLDNAIKYTPSGGRVTVSAGLEGSEVAIIVSDSGIGIPDDERPRIWERLYRGDRSRSQRGLGLGLSLVRAIVEAHGGRVEVSSTMGEGSTFTIHLPVSQPEHDTDVMRL